MNFEKMLEYQNIDKALFKIERDLNNSEEKERAAKLDSMMKKASENMSAFNAEADELMSSVDKNEANIAMIEKEISEIALHYKNVDDITEIEYYEKKLATLADDMEKAEKELFKLSSRMDFVKDNSEKLTMQAMQIKDQFTRAMQAYQGLRAKLSQEGAPVVATMKAIEKDIPKELMDIYRRCRANKRLPAFVEYAKDGLCAGCGMNLPNDCVNKLKASGDMVECPNCGREVIIK